jgi:hypothetical protein
MVVVPEVNMKVTGKQILLVTLALLSGMIVSTAQRHKRTGQQQELTQASPLVRAFRGRGKSGKDLPRAEKLEIGGDQLGQILKSDTLVRLSVRTNFVSDRGYLVFRTGISTSSGLNSETSNRSDINGLIGKARFTGLTNEIEIGVKPQPNKLYLLDVSIRQQPNCDRCSYSITGPDGHKETWTSNGSDSQHLYFTIITNDADWYPLVFRGGYSFEFEGCAVHEVQPL